MQLSCSVSACARAGVEKKGARRDLARKIYKVRVASLSFAEILEVRLGISMMNIVENLYPPRFHHLFVEQNFEQ